jgi:acyl-CoA thioesterase FadM
VGLTGSGQLLRVKIVPNCFAALSLVVSCEIWRERAEVLFVTGKTTCVSTNVSVRILIQLESTDLD